MRDDYSSMNPSPHDAIGEGPAAPHPGHAHKSHPLRVGWRRLGHGLQAAWMDLRWQFLRAAGVPCSLTPPTRIINVNPAAVKWVQALGNVRGLPEVPRSLLERDRFHATRAAGRILPGDWDHAVMPFDELEVCRGLRQRFVEGRSWHRTDGFRVNVRRRLHRAWRYGQCRKRMAFVRRRFREIEQMYAEFSRDAYRRQRDISGRSLDELGINIGRNGELIRNSGARHRTALAAIAGCSFIPARVIVRHAEWESRRREMAALPPDAEIPSHLMPFLDHPDMRDVRGAAR